MTRKGFGVCSSLWPKPARAVNKIWGTTQREDAKKRAMHSGATGTPTWPAIGRYHLRHGSILISFTCQASNFFFLHERAITVGISSLCLNDILLSWHIFIFVDQVGIDTFPFPQKDSHRFENNV